MNIIALWRLLNKDILEGEAFPWDGAILKIRGLGLWCSSQVHPLILRMSLHQWPLVIIKDKANASIALNICRSQGKGREHKQMLVLH
jgi:hypothetical protein